MWLTLTIAIVALESRLVATNQDINYLESELSSGAELNGCTLPGMLDIKFVTECQLPNLIEEKKSYEDALRILRDPKAT